jgi:hypothetical protein
MKLNKLFKTIIGLISIALVFYLLFEEPFRYASTLVYFIYSIYFTYLFFFRKKQNNNI